MAAHDLTPAQMREAVDAVAQCGSQIAAAQHLGIARATLQNRLQRAAQHDIQTQKAEAFKLPDFTEADEHEPIEEVISRMARNFERSKKAHDARQWFPIQFKDNKPIGILFVGDPHVDDNGCNWPVLRRHTEICRDTEGLYAVNIGDSSNCWGGRLIKKYADQDASVHTARRLVRWLLLESGVSWLVWLMGNHEHMGDGAPLLHEMNKRYGTKSVPMLDWEARFVIQFPNGEEVRVNCAHDFAGNSMWNPIHGPVKAAKFGDRIDILVCGHKHNWAVSTWENSEQGTAPLMIRTRGYKHLDDYARRIGKYEQDEGQSVLVVIDPNAKTMAGRAMAFVDVEKGAAYLAHLRS